MPEEDLIREEPGGPARSRSLPEPSGAFRSTVLGVLAVRGTQALRRAAQGPGPSRRRAPASAEPRPRSGWRGVACWHERPLGPDQGTKGISPGAELKELREVSLRRGHRGLTGASQRPGQGFARKRFPSRIGRPPARAAKQQQDVQARTTVQKMYALCSGAFRRMSLFRRSQDPLAAGQPGSAARGRLPPRHAGHFCFWFASLGRPGSRPSRGGTQGSPDGRNMSKGSIR